jgi:Spy/CpxP family protein refolding chaperone
MRRNVLAAILLPTLLIFALTTGVYAAQDTFAKSEAAAAPPAVSAEPMSKAAPQTPAVTPGGPGAMESFGRGMHASIAEKLGLTDDQKSKIRALYVSFFDRTRKAKADLMTLKDEKRTMFLSGKVDQQKLAQLDDQIVKVKTDLMKEKMKLSRDRLAQLTPEQIEKVAHWKAEKAFSRSHRGFHHGCGMMRHSRG